MTEQKPTVQMPLNDFVRELAREAAWHVGNQIIEAHMKDCVARQLEPRVRKLEEWRATFVGIAIGSGVLGGTSAGIVTWLLGG